MNAPKLSLVVIRSKDIGSARKFYETLGLTFEQHKHGKGLEHLASDNGEFVFEIYPIKDSDAPTTSTRLGFFVDSCDNTVRRLLEAGYIIRSRPNDAPWGRVAVAEDFDGHKVELVEKRTLGLHSHEAQ